MAKKNSKFEIGLINEIQSILNRFYFNAKTKFIIFKLFFEFDRLSLLIQFCL